jgi:hypothetical protein
MSVIDPLRTFGQNASWAMKGLPCDPRRLPGVLDRRKLDAKVYAKAIRTAILMPRLNTFCRECPATGTHMKTVAVALGCLVAGFALGYAADVLSSDGDAPWSQQRDMQGCWASGPDRLLIRQGDRRLRFLEAKPAGAGEWLRLKTRSDGDQVVASPSAFEGSLRLSSDADKLTSVRFANVADRDWVRCEILP